MFLFAALALIVQDADPDATATPGFTAEAVEAEESLPADAETLIASFDARYERWGDLVAEMAARRARDRYLRDLLIPMISRPDLDGDVRSDLIAETADTFEAVDGANTQWALSILDDYDFAALNAEMPELALGIVSLVQHGDLDAQQRLLAIVEPLALAGAFDGQRYALLYDRVAEGEGRPQRYGTQDMCVDGVRTVYTLEDPDAVDERRAEMGLMPFEEYWAVMIEQYGEAC